MSLERPYQPSYEEMKNAEDAMSDQQRNASRERVNESAVKKTEQAPQGLELSSQIASAQNFDDLLKTLRGAPEVIPSRTGTGRSLGASNMITIINQYRQGEIPIYVQDMLDGMKDSEPDGGSHNALRKITRTYGLRKKAFELLEKEGSGKFIKLDGTVADKKVQ